MSEIRRNLDALLGAAVPMDGLDQRAANAGTSEVFYGHIIDGGLLIDGDADGVPLPGPFESLVPYAEGSRVAFVLRGRRPLIIQVQGGFAVSDDFAGLTSVGEDNADHIEELDEVQQLLDERQDRLDDALGAFEAWQPSVDQGLADALTTADDAARDAGDALSKVAAAPVSWMIEYSAGTETTPGTVWVATRPSGVWVWRRETVTYGNGSTAVGPAVRVTGPEGPQGTPGQQGIQGVPGEPGEDGLPGKDGVGITNTTIMYAKAASGTVTPTTGWQTTVPASTPGQYLWTRTVWTYSDGDTETGYSVAQWGATGAKGDTGSDGIAGKDGVGITKTDITYAQSTSGTTAPTTGWAENPPTPIAGRYIWTKTVWTYSDATAETGYSVGKIGDTGAKGDKGDTGADGLPGAAGVGLVSTQIRYAKSTSGTVTPTSGWQEAVPASTPGQFLWTRTVWTYSDTSSETGYSVAMWGATGAKGATGSDGVAGKDGVGIKTTTITYAQSTSGTAAPTSGWQAQPPTPVAGRYVWTKTVWTYSDGTDETGYSVGKIGDTGAKGDKGEKGDTGADGLPGKDGVGLASTNVSYVLSSSGVSAPTSGWSSGIPTLVKGLWLWTRTVWVYTDDDTETGYSVAYIPVDGSSGSDGLPGKDGMGLVSTVIRYAVSSSGTVAPTSGWQTKPPLAEPGQYVWTRTVWTYTDATTETGYSVGQYGVSGPQGDEGPRGPKGEPGQGLTIEGNVDTYRQLPGKGIAVDFTKTDFVIQSGQHWESPNLDIPAGETVNVTITAKGDWYQEIQLSIVPGGVEILRDDLSPDFQTFTGSATAPNNSLPKQIRIEYDTYLSYEPLTIQSLHVTAGAPTDPPGPGDAGKAWYNLADGKLYIWDGTKFPAEGDGIQMEGPAAQEALQIAANLQDKIDGGLLRTAPENSPPTVEKGLVWAVIDSYGYMRGLRVPNSNLTGWVPYQLAAEEVLVVGPNGTVYLKDGVVTADTLEADLVLASKIIAGDRAGYHTIMDQTGLHFMSKLAGVSAPKEVLRINTPGTDSDGTVFGLANPNDLDSLVTSINEAGQGSFSDLTVANVAQFQDVIVKGETLPEVVQSYMGRPIPVPLLSGSLVPGPAAPGVQRIAEFSWANPYDSEVQVSFAPTVLPGYLYGAGILMGMWTATTDGTLPPANTASARASGRVRDTAGDTQLVVPAWDITLPAGATLRAHMIMWVHQNATTWTLANGESWRPQVTVNPYPSAEADGVFASIVAASAPIAKKQYTKTYAASWRKTFPANSFYAGKATQGTYNGTTFRGFLGFPNMLSDIGSADIVKIEVYVYMSHWWYNAGGTLSIQGHGQLLEPTAQPGVSGTVVSLTTAKPGGGWVTLPAAYYAGFKAGTLRGIALVGSGLAAYGYATSGQIKVTYKK